MGSSLSTRIRHASIARLPIHIDAHSALPDRVPIPPAGLGVRVEIRSRDEEPKTAIIQLLRLGWVRMAQDRLHRERMDPICCDDQIRREDITRGQRDRGNFWVLITIDTIQ